MSEHSSVRDETGNAFLDSLTSAARDRILPRLSDASLSWGEVLQQPGQPLSAVYFPTRCIISTTAEMMDGGVVEVGLTGREGFIPLSIAFDERTTPHTTVAQVPGPAYSLSAGDFREIFRSNVEFHDRVLTYANYLFIASAQFAACNRLHSIEERYARWLLMCDDRMGGGPFSLTQEYSSQMLGVRRASVTIAAGIMSRAGLITYRRGRISISDREKLEEAACECYRFVNDEFRRLLGRDLSLRQRDEHAPVKVDITENGVSSKL